MRPRHAEQLQYRGYFLPAWRLLCSRPHSRRPRRSWFGSSKRAKPRWDGGRAGRIGPRRRPELGAAAGTRCRQRSAWHVAPLPALLKRRDGAGRMQAGSRHGKAEPRGGALRPATSHHDDLRPPGSSSQTEPLTWRRARGRGWRQGARVPHPSSARVLGSTSPLFSLPPGSLK